MLLLLLVAPEGVVVVVVVAAKADDGVRSGDGLGFVVISDEAEVVVRTTFDCWSPVWIRLSLPEWFAAEWNKWNIFLKYR